MGSILFRTLLTLAVNAPGGQEDTDKMAPAYWQGNPWGPEATVARFQGELPHVPETPRMARWDRWGKQNLRDGDLLFRLGDARILYGYFPFSRFIARASGSIYSHTGIVAVEDGEPVVYDTTKAGVRRMPFKVWIVDNIGAMGVKRLKPSYQDRVPQILAFCRSAFERQVPFDFDLELSDEALYCVEMSEKAFRSAGLKLSDPIRLGDMERAHEFPIRILMLQKFSYFVCQTPLSLEQPVFFPGNERHGLWSSPLLETVYPDRPVSAVEATGIEPNGATESSAVTQNEPTRGLREVLNPPSD